MERTIAYLHVCAANEQTVLLFHRLKRGGYQKQSQLQMLHTDSMILASGKELNEYKLGKLRFLHFLSGKVTSIQVFNSTALSRLKKKNSKQI